MVGTLNNKIGYMVPNIKSMKIGIDARFVGPQGTGLGKYTQKLIENLARIDKQNQYAIFLRKSNWDYLKLPSNFKKVKADIPWYSLAEQIKMPNIYNKENLDLLHVPHFNVPIIYKGKFVVTIHDLIHHQFSEYAATTKSPLVFKVKRFAYKKIISSAIKRSRKIIAPSNFVKGEIIKNFHVNPNKIVVTYEAAEEEYGENPNSKIQTPNLLKRYKIKTPFIIYVGNAYPHKNLDVLLQAFKIIGNWKLEREALLRKIGNLKLVIVCSRDVFASRMQNKIKSLGLEDSVIMTGYIPAEDLSAIFKQASTYTFPSLVEGFGIPGLNAMAAGVPVAASNIETLKEIYSDAAIYFDPNDPGDIANEIIKIVSDGKIRSSQIKKGREQIKKYSWKQMAQETLKVYEEIFRKL